MQFRTKLLFALFIVNACETSLTFSADNYHDQQMAIRTNDANSAKAIINQHKTRIAQIKEDAATEHRKISENTKQKKNLARKIKNTKQRNTNLKLIDQEAAKQHSAINARKKTLQDDSAKLKKSQLEASRARYTSQLDKLEKERQKTINKTKKRNSKAAAKPQPTGTPRRAFSTPIIAKS